LQYRYEHGVATIGAGTYNNVLRLLVPLTVEDAQFGEGMHVIEAAISSVSSATRISCWHLT